MKETFFLHLFVLLSFLVSYHKRMISLQKAVGKFEADGIGFLRRNLARLEGLAHLIGDNFMFLRPPGISSVLAARQRKFRVGGMRIAGISGDEFAIPCFVWVGCIV